MVDSIKRRVKSLKRIAVVGHSDWFGNPEKFVNASVNFASGLFRPNSAKSNFASLQTLGEVGM